MASIQFGAGGFVDAAEWARMRLNEFGVRQPAGNRLSVAHALIRSVNDRKIIITQDDECSLYRISEAHWTIFEQYIIARSLGKLGRQLRPILIEKLELMLSGAQTENEDSNSLARNTQFELFTAAMMTMGNVPIFLGEPDLLIAYLGVRVGVAAKRVRSIKKLLKRAKEAVEQIRRSRLPGIVALNVDRLLKETCTEPADSVLLDERLLALKEVDELLSEQHEVLASIVFARDAIWRFGGKIPAFDFSNTYRFWTYPRNKEQEAHGEEFWRTVREHIDQRINTI